MYGSGLCGRMYPYVRMKRLKANGSPIQPAIMCAHGSLHAQCLCTLKYSRNKVSVIEYLHVPMSLRVVLIVFAHRNAFEL